MQIYQLEHLLYYSLLGSNLSFTTPLLCSYDTLLQPLRSYQDFAAGPPTSVRPIPGCPRTGPVPALVAVLLIVQSGPPSAGILGRDKSSRSSLALLWTAGRDRYHGTYL